MKNELVGIAVAVVCAVVVIGTVLVPSIEEYTNIYGTVENDGYYTMSEYQSTDTYVASWDYSNPYYFTVNGEVVQLPTSVGTYAYTVIGGTDMMVRYYISSAGTIYLQVWINGSTAVYEAKTSNSTSMDVEVSDGVMTFDNGSGTTTSVTLSDSFYSVVNDGDYVMKSPDSSGYVLEDSEIIAIGVTTIYTASSTTKDECFTIIGSIADGFTATYTPYEVELGEITADYSTSANEDYVGLLDFDNLSFTATYSDTYETDVVYSQVLVPVEVTAELSQHLSDSEITLFEIIPLFLILAVLLTVTYAIMRNRD